MLLAYFKKKLLKLGMTTENQINGKFKQIFNLILVALSSNLLLLHFFFLSVNKELVQNYKLREGFFRKIFA
jgi:hypothetical protein